MSNKLSNGFWGKITLATLLASSLSSATLGGAMAQGDVLSPNTGASSSASSNNSSAAATDSSTAAATSAASAASTSAPLPGGNGGGSAAANVAPTATTTAVTTPTSEVPPGVLWTDPKYAVKEVPQPIPPAKSVTNTNRTSTTTSVYSGSTGYDDKGAQSFADSVSMPQYVWTRKDAATKGHKASALASKEMAGYNKTLVEKFVANMTVPNQATLVDNSQSNYVYLISFTVDNKGKIGHINSEKSFGQFNAVNLADDNTNRAMIATITQALTRCSPVAVPPSGDAPWYMLLKYEPNTGKVFVANLNTI